MASAMKPLASVDRRSRRVKEETGLLELDATFGRMLGLVDGQKVCLRCLQLLLILTFSRSV